MSFLHNISTVARYEARTLRRSWFFRLFSTGAIFIFSIMNLGLFSPIGDEDWDLVSIPSTVPLINLYLLNIGQAIVVIFLAADFLKRDKKLDTNEVLYTRPMSNLEYIVGKTWGILRLFLSLDILILSIGLLMNIISKSMKVDIISYIEYLLIISVPTILFSLGLAFLMMSVIRNQAITFLILLGFAALDIFYLWYRLGSLFDYMAFGLPVFKSGMIGFDNRVLILNQRLMYLSAGIALVLASVLLFKRLPQSKLHSALSAVLLVIFTAIAAICTKNTYSIHADSAKVRKEVTETNREFENSLFPYVTAESIDLLHSGDKITATAEVVIRNENECPLDKYLFSLNPALKVSMISSQGKNLEFSRIKHIIEVKPGEKLGTGETDTLLISYEGSIDESFCYPDYKDNINEDAYRIAMVNVNKRQAFLQDQYVLLTPETHWYPVASLNYYPSNPARLKIDFTKYTLRVKEEQGLSVVSQGYRQSKDGFSSFAPENPLTGLTLAIGNYFADTLRVDSVDYISYYFPGHDYYKKDLSEINDTVKMLLSGIMRELETNFSVKYPFRTLSLVEVPVQYYSYPRESTQTRAEVQPSLVLLPEKLSTLENSGFYKQFTRQKKRMARNNQIVTDKELKVRIFNSFIRNTFISGENFRFVKGEPVNEPTRYRLGPSFYFFRNNFYSSEYPVVNAAFETHLQQIQQIGPRGGYFGMSAISDNDKANLILRGMSFKDLLKENPMGDTIRTVLSVKGDWLFNLLRAKAGMEEFNTWFSEYLNENKFSSINITKLNSDIKNRFGFEFYPYLNDWFNGKDQPGFLFEDIRANEVVIGDRSRYYVTFTAVNAEHVAGLFNISFRTGGGRGGQTNFFQGGPGPERFTISMQGRGMETENISRIVFMDSMQARRIGILLDYQPREMLINTLYARNIPGQISKPINDIAKKGRSSNYLEEEELLPHLPDMTDASEIIVDNEDSGFKNNMTFTQSPLKKLLGISNNPGKEYQQVRMYNFPEYWQPVIQSTYYGRYVLSSVYTGAGKGERKVTWSAVIKKPGYYDVYCFIGKTEDRIRRVRPEQGPEAQGGSGENQEENLYKDMHYRILHDQGVEEITVDYENADGGWNNLGRYYISSDTAKVELTNESSGRIVIADAVKWVKQD
jgi:hypothetical protein